ncbi:hypothetical protein LWI28_010405 [Acer negundo]|uniref:Alpha-1,2-Mannosidase n=1 Tax=Acer negundo TaxID=4023 RepID=A0AAD5NP73_ACENE|nr:hypothetical protein LWI28_010405 [Acer negundo]
MEINRTRAIDLEREKEITKRKGVVVGRQREDGADRGSKFYHAYENYLTHAFPHDELKPLTKSFTYSLSELRNPKCSIRVLGGLVSAHILATDSANRLVQGSYKNQLLTLAEDLGSHFLPAFNTPTGLPYAWINLKM